MHGLGHVGGAFELTDGTFVCSATEMGGSDDRKGFWEITVGSKDEVEETFKEKSYTDYERLEVFHANPEQAERKMAEGK